MDNKQLLELAKNFHAKKQYWQAKFYFEDYLSQNPFSEYALEQLAEVCEKKANYEDAILYFSKALIKNPQKYIFLYKIGYCHQCLGNLEEAKKFYNNYLKLSPEKDEARIFGIGVLHAKRGLWKEASLAYEWKLREDIDLSPIVAELYFKLATAYNRQYLWQKAAIAYENAINLSDIIKPYWCYKCGESFERAENYPKAEEYYKEAVKRTSEYKDYWYFRLGVVCEKNGNFKLANHYFTQSRKRTIAHAVDAKIVIKNKAEEFLSTYAEYYETLELDEKIILFESYFGQMITCNTYALLLYLLKNNYNFTTYVVVIRDSNTIIPDELKYDRRVVFIKRNSDNYLRYLCSAKYLVNNCTFHFNFIRKKGQKYLNTWHGTPMKHLGAAMNNSFEEESGNTTRNFLHATHIISPNRHTTNVILNDYGVRNILTGNLAEIGYPRNDLTINISKERKQELKDFLGIKNNLPIVFYCPTYRGSFQSANADKEKLLYDFQNLLSDKYNIIYRGHHADVKGNYNLDMIIQPPDSINSNELLGITDILISDYSSISYDFLSLKKPIINYIYDYEEYKEERGLYFEPKEFPGQICYTINEVKDTIEEILKGNFTIKEECVKEYANLDDGKACKRVADFFLNDKQDFVYKYEKKKTNLFYLGTFMSNGITNAAINLLNGLSDTNNGEYENILCYSFAEVNKEKQRVENFKQIHQNLNFYKRCGQLICALEELWVNRKFEEQYYFPSSNFKSSFEKIYQREVKRLFADSSFTNVINFEGYTNFWIRILAYTPASRKLIFLHSDMFKEFQKKHKSLLGLFKYYPYYDNLVSASKNVNYDNSETLSKLLKIPKAKFTYSQNILSYESILSSAEQIDIDDADFLEYENFSGKKFLIVARLSPEKQHILLIQAFSKVVEHNPNIRLYIMGQGPLQELIKKNIEELKLKNKVILLGQKRNPYQYISRADCLLLSSQYEGQGLVLLEAMILKTPLITTDFSGVKAVLEMGKGKDGYYGLLVENSEEGLISGMEKFLAGEDCGGEFDAKSYNEKAISDFLSLLEK